MDSWSSQDRTGDVDEVATRDLVEARVAEVRAEIGELRGEMRVGLAKLREETADLRVDVSKEIRHLVLVICGGVLTLATLLITLAGLVVATR
jgi:hypothetical protein